MSPEPETTTGEFFEALKEWGFTFFAGVPCSYFKDMVGTIERDFEVTYLSAVREDVAVGLAVGAYFGGQKSMVLMQNSGLGVCMNALTSLAILYKIPLLILITWRGYQAKDAPEHILMGQVMLTLLEDIGVPYRILHPESVEADLADALTTLAESATPVAVILRKGVLI